MSENESQGQATTSAPDAEDGNGADNERSRSFLSSHPVLWWLVVAVLLMLIVPLAVFGIAYSQAEVPEPEEQSAKQVSQILASDSETELARIVPPEGNRQQVTLEQVPKHTQDAVLAAEDREFWSNPGFSLSGFVRAVIGQVTGNDSAGGGSTITQQYVKNTLVGNERTVQRKLRELVYSAKMTREWSKEEILAGYLNTVYFGRNAYGVSAAADAYFGKPVEELTVEESAVLAAAIQRPSELDPWNNREEAEQRWNYVLDGMVGMGELPPEEREGMEYPETRDPAEYEPYTEATGPNGLIKDQVIRELEAKGVDEQDVTTGGLKITTTIDAQAQQQLVDSVNEILETQNDNIRTGVVSVEPSTQAVRAYYGGEEANGWDYANAPVPTGSAFKIFGLAAALEQGIPLSTQYSSDPVTLPGDITVENVDGNVCGYCSIEEALKRSHNTSFIRLQDDLENTTQDTADMAHALGIARSLPGIDETLTENGEQPYEGIVLGQYQSRPWDMAIALGTLTNRGVWHDPHFVQRVENARGDVLYEREDTAGERRVSAQVADNVIQAMEPIAAWSNNNDLAGGRPSATKTGTTQLGDTGYNQDAWLVGSTSQLSTAVWVGTEDNSPLVTPWGGQVYGSGLPIDIWKRFMDQALEGEEIKPFPDAQPVTWGDGNYGGGGNPGDPQGYVPQQPQQQQQVPQQQAPQQQQPVQPQQPAPQQPAQPQQPTGNAPAAPAPREGEGEQDAAPEAPVDTGEPQ